VTYFSAGFGMVAFYAIFVLVLLVRPMGILRK
jgi:branched-subunit amino acid ABC-type transport system permease component